MRPYHSEIADPHYFVFLQLTQVLKGFIRFPLKVRGGKLLKNKQNIEIYKRLMSFWFCKLAIFVVFLCVSQTALGLTASKVFFEFWPAKSIYRVVVHYTIPELKEAREARVEFRSKRKAEKYYFALVRGADFYLNDPGTIRFIQPKLEPNPW